MQHAFVTFLLGADRLAESRTVERGFDGAKTASSIDLRGKERPIRWSFPNDDRQSNLGDLVATLLQHKLPTAEDVAFLRSLRRDASHTDSVVSEPDLLDEVEDVLDEWSPGSARHLAWDSCDELLLAFLPTRQG
jgi:hypothetical protein